MKAGPKKNSRNCTQINQHGLNYAIWNEMWRKSIKNLLKLRKKNQISIKMYQNWSLSIKNRSKCNQKQNQSKFHFRMDQNSVSKTTEIYQKKSNILLNIQKKLAKIWFTKNWLEADPNSTIWTKNYLKMNQISQNLTENGPKLNAKIKFNRIWLRLIFD